MLAMQDRAARRKTRGVAFSFRHRMRRPRPAVAALQRECESVRLGGGEEVAVVANLLAGVAVGFGAEVGDFGGVVGSGEGVGAGAAGEEVVSGAADEAVVAGVAQEHVVAGAAEEDVVAGAAGE